MNIKVTVREKAEENEEKRCIQIKQTYFFYDKLWLVLSFEFNHYG